jgi:hypothetical protein
MEDALLDFGISDDDEEDISLSSATDADAELIVTPQAG